MTHQEALDKHLGFMDYTAVTLAQQERLPIRVFNVSTPQALLKVAEREALGTIIRT
jgi:uridylate kinase